MENCIGKYLNKYTVITTSNAAFNIQQALTFSAIIAITAE